jgi:hypothetical protein
MLTSRQVERIWNQGQFQLLSSLCLEMRPEYSARLLADLSGSVPAAALAVIRFDEFGQSHLPLVTRLLRHILAAQEPDGGWGNPLLTALALRALLTCSGDGPAIDRGLASLATLQKDDGLWPRIPVRRMPADPFASAFILLQLSPFSRFRSVVRFRDALHQFEADPFDADAETRQLARILRLRYRAVSHAN